MEKIKVVYYINQFFGQEGGEESASIGIKVHEGAFGLAQSFADAYGEDCEVLATIVCGDNYIAEKLEEVTAEIVEMIAGYDPDLFVAYYPYGRVCKEADKQGKIGSAGCRGILCTWL